MAAIERIEVLADGASAIYGTDAVAGVVNIILKTDYEGFESGGRYGWSTNKGNTAERSGYIVGGTGNGKTNITISAEWVKVDPVWNFERSYSDPTFGTPTFAGSVTAAPAITCSTRPSRLPRLPPAACPLRLWWPTAPTRVPARRATSSRSSIWRDGVMQTTGNQREAFLHGV